MEVGGHRKIGRPKLRRSAVIRKHSRPKRKLIKIEEAKVRRTSISKTRCADPNWKTVAHNAVGPT